MRARVSTSVGVHGRVARAGVARVEVAGRSAVTRIGARVAARAGVRVDVAEAVAAERRVRRALVIRGAARAALVLDAPPGAGVLQAIAVADARDALPVLVAHGL